MLHLIRLVTAPEIPAIHNRPGSALLERFRGVGDEIGYFAQHTRSLRLVTRLFSPRAEGRMARAYSYCRFIDDLVDDPTIDRADAAGMVDEWMDLSRRAYSGRSTGIALLDRVMTEMADARVPFRYADELAEGMRMDIRGERYASLQELQSYTYRVASVVALWVSELFGVRDPVVLARASAMGHALQLTNILRDVGDDLRIGRCYLPADMMLRHGVTEIELSGGRQSPGYGALIEEIMDAAECAFRDGFEGLEDLPRILRMPVSVASHVYRGTLDEIRRNGYDNLTRRASLSSPQILLLAGRAMFHAAASPLRQWSYQSVGR